MTTAPTAKVAANEHGVFTSTSKSGKIRIGLAGPDTVIAQAHKGWEVWCLYTGTHDLVPGTRRTFGAGDEAAARRYANDLWRTR